MTETTDYSTAEGDARRLLEQQIEDRVAAVRLASVTLAADEEAERAYASAAAARAAAWRDALAIGWTEKELHDVGLRAPGKKAPRSTPDKGRRSSTRTRVESPAAANAAGDVTEGVTD